MELIRTPGSVFVKVTPPPSVVALHATSTYFQKWAAAVEEIVAMNIPKREPLPPLTAEQVFQKTIYTYICNSVWKRVLVTGDARSLQICSVRGVRDFAITGTFSGHWNGTNKSILKRNGIYMKKSKGRWYVHIPIRALFSDELHALFAK